MVGRNVLPHPLFDPGQILVGQGLGRFNIVIEAVFNGRPDPQPAGRKQLQHGLGQHMGAGVAQAVQRIVLIAGEIFTLEFVRLGLEAGRTLRDVVFCFVHGRLSVLS